MAQNAITLFSPEARTLEVNYLSVSARSDARVLLYGERPSRNAFSLFTSSVQFKPCCPYDYSFILSPLSGNTIKLRYAVAQYQDEDTQEINYVCSSSAQIHHSALSDLLNSISRYHRSFSLQSLQPIMRDVLPILYSMRGTFFRVFDEFLPIEGFFFHFTQSRSHKCYSMCFKMIISS